MATGSLADRIEAAFDRAIKSKSLMQYSQLTMRLISDDAKLEHRDEYAGAKNNDVRAVLLHDWLQDELEYWAARKNYDEARDDYRLALLEIERLKLLVALERGA